MRFPGFWAEVEDWALQHLAVLAHLGMWIACHGATWKSAPTDVVARQALEVDEFQRAHELRVPIVGAYRTSVADSFERHRMITCLRSRRS